MDPGDPLGAFGGTSQQGRNGRSDRQFKVLDDHVRVLWGDGITDDGIRSILWHAEQAGFAAENLVFGMGGGLHQKHDRDTQRNAFKASAQHRDGVWHDIRKVPLDASKASKAGHLALVPYGVESEEVQTVTFDPEVGPPGDDMLQTVFKDGKLIKEITFDEVRANAGWLA